VCSTVSLHLPKEYLNVLTCKIPVLLLVKKMNFLLHGVPIYTEKLYKNDPFLVYDVYRQCFRCLF